MQVLVITESKPMQEIIANNFETGKYVLDRVGSVKGALHQLATKKYDLVLSDYELVDGSGIQLLKELRDSGNKVRFIIFTMSMAEAIDESRFLDTMPDGFIDVGDMDAFLINIKSALWAASSAASHGVIAQQY